MVYVPNIREWLARLEGRGDGDTREAVALRRTLSRIDFADAKSCH
jgi:hypothetical protein